MEAFVSIFLIFSSSTFIMLFCTTGFAIFNRNIFASVIMLNVFSMVINAYLKSIWQIPLPPSVGEGWAFPSGHMQQAVVLWLYLAIRFNKIWLYIIAVFLLNGIGWSTVYSGYHNRFDIMGAVAVAILFVPIYAYLLKRYFNKHQFLFHGFTIVVQLLIIIFCLPSEGPYNYYWLLHFSAVSISFLIGWRLAEYWNIYLDRLKYKIGCAGLNILSVLVYHNILTTMPEADLILYISICFLLGITVSFLSPAIIYALYYLISTRIVSMQ